MFRLRPSGAGILSAAAVVTFAATDASAVVSVIAPGAFPASSLLVDVSTLAIGTEVNGLSLGGLSFGYSLGDGKISVQVGPGVTPDLSSRSFVSFTPSNAGVLTVLFLALSSQFGYGYALNRFGGGSIPNSTIVSLFDGVTNVGSLSFSASGGFAGIQSTLPFDRATLSFESVNALAFAVGNFRVTAVPEPSVLGFWLFGLAALGWQRRAVRATAPQSQA